MMPMPHLLFPIAHLQDKRFLPSVSFLAGFILILVCHKCSKYPKCLYFRENLL